MTGAPSRPASHPGARAAAFACGYQLLARLVASAPDSDTDDAMDTGDIAASSRLAAAIADASPDRLAADHYHVFGLVAPPFEGLVRDPEGRVGARAGERLRATLARVEVTPRLDEEPEHLAVQLAALAALCEREADSADRAAAGRARRGAIALLDDHVLRWLLPYEAAVARIGRAYPAAVIALVLDVVTAHRESLAGPTDDDQGSAVADHDALPALGLLDLADPDTGLRDIARALARPAIGGVLVTRGDIAQIGRDAGVPRGFGDRALLLANLLDAAASLGRLPEVAGGLARLARAHADATAARMADAPWLTRFVTPWQRRAAHTADALDQVARAAAALTPDRRC